MRLASAIVQGFERTAEEKMKPLIVAILVGFTALSTFPNTASAQEQPFPESTTLHPAMETSSDVGPEPLPSPPLLSHSNLSVPSDSHPHPPAVTLSKAQIGGGTALLVLGTLSVQLAPLPFIAASLQGLCIDPPPDEPDACADRHENTGLQVLGGIMVVGGVIAVGAGIALLAQGSKNARLSRRTKVAILNWMGGGVF
jgi:hypothetical protein